MKEFKDNSENITQPSTSSSPSFTFLSSTASSSPQSYSHINSTNKNNHLHNKNNLDLISNKTNNNFDTARNNHDQNINQKDFNGVNNGYHKQNHYIEGSNGMVEGANVETLLDNEMKKIQAKTFNNNQTKGLNTVRPEVVIQSVNKHNNNLVNKTAFTKYPQSGLIYKSNICHLPTFLNSYSINATTSAFTSPNKNVRTLTSFASNSNPNSSRFNTNKENSRWLTLEVCRKHLSAFGCPLKDTECQFAHPDLKMVDVMEDGRVMCCYDFIKSKCTRQDPPCRFHHPPLHLREVLLYNGKQNLIFKNLKQQQQQQFMVQQLILQPQQNQSYFSQNQQLPQQTFQQNFNFQNQPFQQPFNNPSSHFQPLPLQAPFYSENFKNLPTALVPVNYIMSYPLPTLPGPVLTTQFPSPCAPKTPGNIPKELLNKPFNGDDVAFTNGDVEHEVENKNACEKNDDNNNAIKIDSITKPVVYANFNIKHENNTFKTINNGVVNGMNNISTPYWLVDYNGVTYFYPMQSMADSWNGTGQNESIDKFTNLNLNAPQTQTNRKTDSNVNDVTQSFHAVTSIDNNFCSSLIT